MDDIFVDDTFVKEVFSGFQGFLIALEIRR